MNTETLEKPATAIAEYSPTVAALGALRQRLANVAYDTASTKGMDVAKKDRAEVRGLRVALEAKRVELKAPALERSRLIDAEAKAITVQLLALETPIDEQIKAEETRKAQEKAAKEEAERQAASVILGRIDTIRGFAIVQSGVKAAGIQVAIDKLTAIEITLEAYGVRAGEAAQAKAQTLARLAEMHEAAAAFEAEQARIAAEKVELARQRAEQEAREAAHRAQVAAEQKAAAAKLADERATFEKEQAAARKVRDEEDRIAREARAAEDKRLADARAELEAQQRAARQAVEAQAATARKVEQDRLDAAAAVERKRLDDEAAVRRAEEERVAAERRAEQRRQHEIEVAAEHAQERKRGAAEVMYGALQVVAATPRIPKEVMAVVKDAIALATGTAA